MSCPQPSTRRGNKRIVGQPHLEQASLHLALHVHEDLERVVRADDERVQVSHPAQHVSTGDIRAS